MSNAELVNLIQPGVEHETKTDPLSIVELQKYNASDQTLDVSPPQQPKDNELVNECLKVDLIKSVETNINGTSATSKITEFFDAKLKLLPHEIKQIEKLLTEFICINSSKHQDYQSALDTIETHDGLLSFIEANNSNVLAISTNKQIYIFDIIALGGELPQQLKNVLTNKYKQKIVHNVRAINAKLWKKYKFQLSGIVDTHVAYCQTLGQAQTKITLIATIAQVLHVPVENFQLTDDATLLQQKVNLAKLVIFQMKLYHRLIYDCLLGNFKVNCEKFATTFENLNDADAALVMSVKSTAGFEHIQLPQGKKVAF